MLIKLFVTVCFSGAQTYSSFGITLQSEKMSTRRSRFSLCLVRRSESPKSPIDDRTRSSTSERSIPTDSGCSTPLNTRKNGSKTNGDSPLAYELDHSPIPMSQGASNLVSGVSWAWNSPKRAVPNDHRVHLKPLSSNNQTSYKDLESSRSYQKKTSSKLTGFHRFQSELKLLQEQDESSDDPFKAKKTLSCASIQVVPPTSPPPSPEGSNLFLIKNAHKKTSALDSLVKSTEASNSFNNSDFDNLLLQASQAAERDESTSDKSQVKETLSCTSMQVIPPTSPPPSPDLQREITNKETLKKTQRRESHMFKTVNGSDSFNNSDLDNLLLQASQAVEKQFDATDKLPKRANLTLSTAQEQQYVKRRSFFKSMTTDNFNSNSDDSFPEVELELLIGASKTIGESTVDGKNSEKHSEGYSRKNKILTRHKSMPESPSHKIVNSKSSNAKWKTGAQSPTSISSSSNGSVTLVPNENDMIVINSSSGGSSTASATTTAPPRKCSKEEIEQKRQEALKRQASRLKRLMQGNHSQSEAPFFKSRFK